MKLYSASLLMACIFCCLGESFVHGEEEVKESVRSSSIFKHSGFVPSADLINDSKEDERQGAAWDHVKSLRNNKSSDLFESVHGVPTFTRMKYVAVAVWWNSLDNENTIWDIDLDGVRDKLNIVEQYYRDMSWNKVNLTIALHSEQVVLQMSDDDSGHVTFASAGRALVADLGYTKGVDYDGIIIITFGGESATSNWAHTNGNFATIIYSQHSISSHAVRHEIGHNIGHEHHKSNHYLYRENRTLLSSPFDGWDMMSGGNTYAVSDIAAASKWFLNWISDSSIIHMQPEGPTYECPDCLSSGTFTLMTFDDRQLPPTEGIKMGIHIPIASVNGNLYSYWLSYRGAGNMGFAAKGLSVHLTYFYSQREPFGAEYDSQNYDAFGDTTDVDGRRDSFVEVGTCYHIFPSAYMKDIDITSVTEVQPVVCVDSIDLGTSITISVSFLDPYNIPIPSLATIETTIDCPTSGSSTSIEVNNMDYNLIRVNSGRATADVKIDIMNTVGYILGNYATTAYFYDNFPHASITFGSEPAYGSYMSLPVDYIKLCTPTMYVDVPGPTVVVVKQNLNEHLRLSEIEIYDVYGNNIANEAFCSSYSRERFGMPACLNDGVKGSGIFPDSCYSHSAQVDLANFDYCVFKEPTQILKVKIFPFYDPENPSAIESLRDLQVQLYAGMEGSGPTANFLGLLADYRLDDVFTDNLPHEQYMSADHRFQCTNTEDPTYKTTTYISDYGTTYIAIPPLSDEGKVKAQISCAMTGCRSAFYLSNGACECAGGLVFDVLLSICKLEEVQTGITSARGWRILSTNINIWGVYELEFYSTTDCTGPFAEHSLGTIVESGHITGGYEPDNAFGKPYSWGGTPDYHGNSYIGKMYDTDIEVRCIRVQNALAWTTSELGIQAYNEVEDEWVTTFVAKNLDTEGSAINTISMSHTPTSNPTYESSDLPSRSPSSSPTSYPSSVQPSASPSKSFGKKKCSVWPDPHFKPFTYPYDFSTEKVQNHYDFHYGCDVVFLQNPNVEIHLRLEEQKSWSLVRSVGVKIGDDILQVTSNEFKYYVNDPDRNTDYDVNTSPLPNNSKIGSWDMEVFSSKPYRGKTQNNNSPTIELRDPSKAVKITIQEHLGPDWRCLMVDVVGEGNTFRHLFSDTRGMCSRVDADDQDVFARDGTVLPPVKKNDQMPKTEQPGFGEEWQVTDTDTPILSDPNKETNLGNHAEFPAKCYNTGSRRLQHMHLRNQYYERSLQTPTCEFCQNLWNPVIVESCEFDASVLGCDSMDDYVYTPAHANFFPGGQPVFGKDFPCVNSEDFFFNDEKETCQWIRFKEERRNEYCQYQTVRVNCPLSCGLCCENDDAYTFTAKFGKGGKTKDCDWLGKKEKRQEKYCGEKDDGDEFDEFQNGKMIRDACPKSCKYCVDPVSILGE